MGSMLQGKVRNGSNLPDLTFAKSTSLGCIVKIGLKEKELLPFDLFKGLGLSISAIFIAGALEIRPE